MRVVTLHPDVLVATSRVWQTTCTVLRGADEGFVVDSPVLPDELEVLPEVLERAGFPFSGLLVTHADWDHLLARQSFGAEVPIGCAETTAARLTAEPGAAQRALRAFDDEHYVERPPLSLGAVQALPVPGHLEVGGRELELHPADGHTDDGMAIWAPWAGVLVCGDYLSPVEIPGFVSRSAYLATLARLEPLVEQADWVVPGHGEPLDGARAMAILREDRAYLEALPDASLPLARRTAAQKRLHEQNLQRL